MSCWEPDTKWTSLGMTSFRRTLPRDVKQFDGYPRLAGGFRSSVPGLHFIGATAARSFGPLLYFVAGTEFASRELVPCILKDRR